MKFRLLASFTISMLVAACGSTAGKYSYAPKHPDESPATITMAGNMDSDWSYHVKKINGVSTEGIERPQRISPGQTSLDVQVDGKEYNPLMTNFTFMAEPGEQYEMRFIAPRGQKEAQTLALADSKRHIVQRMRIGTSENALLVPKLSPAAEAPKKAVKKSSKKKSAQK